MSGTVSATGDPCTACSAGKQPNANRTLCERCTCAAENTLMTLYSPDGAGCVPCALGKQPDSGATDCIDCPAGKAGNQTAGLCVACLLGEQPNENRTACELCPDGPAVCTDIDGCDSVNCGANASCEDVDAPGTGYTCVCDTGYGGTTTTDGPATCIPDEDCAGTWSECTDACEAADDRTWTETAAQVGGGAACPTATACAAGDGACPTVEDKASDAATTLPLAFATAVAAALA